MSGWYVKHAEQAVHFIQTRAISGVRGAVPAVTSWALSSDIDSAFGHGSQAVVRIELGNFGEAELMAFQICWRCD